MSILEIILECLPSVLVGSIFSLILIQSRKIDKLESDIAFLQMRVDTLIEMLKDSAVRRDDVV